jgi:hypothetical protein
MKKSILTILSAFLLFYLLICFSFSWITFSIVSDSLCYDDVEDSRFSNVITQEFFDYLDYRQYSESVEGTSVYFEEQRTFPVTVFLFNKAISLYSYTYAEYTTQDSQVVMGSWHVPIYVTYELKDWKWVVTDAYETP